MLGSEQRCIKYKPFAHEVSLTRRAGEAWAGFPAISVNSDEHPSFCNVVQDVM